MKYGSNQMWIRYIAAGMIFAFGIFCFEQNGLAQSSQITILASPHQTSYHAGGMPITFSVQTSIFDPEVTWKLIGPGELEGNGRSTVYTPPKNIDRESIPITVTAIVRTTVGREESATFKFSLLPALPQVKAGMGTGTKVVIGVGALAAVGGGVALAMRGDDEDDLLDVAGEWVFEGIVTADTCSFLDTGFPEETSERILMFQDNTTLSAEHRLGDVLRGNWDFSGTLRGDVWELAANNPNEVTEDGCTYSLGSGMEAHSINNNKGNGTFNVTINTISGCSGACQIVWSGVWTRLR